MARESNLSTKSLGGDAPEDFEIAIADHLKSIWSDIALEPLPVLFTLAISGLTMSAAVPRESWLEPIMLHPLTPIALPIVGLAVLILLYLIKSALGIDFFDGPSPFHFIFFD